MADYARILQSSGIPSVVYIEDALVSSRQSYSTLPFSFHATSSKPLLALSRENSLSGHSGEVLQDDERRRNLCTPSCSPSQWHDSSIVSKPEDEPLMILIVPRSHFHFDVTDSTRMRGLIPQFDPSDEPIRFPTIPAFLDAIIDTMFEPVDGVSHLAFPTSYISVFLSYLVLYNVHDQDGPIDSDTEDLLPAAMKLLEGVKPETSFLDKFLRTGSLRMTELRAERERLKSARIAKQPM